MQRSKDKFKKGLVLLVLLLFVFSLTACSYGAQGKLIFGTYFDMNLKGKGSAKTGKNILDKMYGLENLLSTSIDDSDISKINNSKKDIPVSVSKDTIFLLNFSKTLYEQSGKAFNPALFPIVELWNLSPKNYIFNKTVPSKKSIDSTLEFCDFSYFIIDEESNTVIKTHDEAKLYLGAIAKGYAVDTALKMSKNTDNALINAGGTIGYSGGSVKIGISDPRGENLFGTVILKNSSIATSGDYERYFELNKKRYHHIFAHNGYPAGLNDENPIISVSVTAKSATVCDALSTTLFILGKSAENMLNTYEASAIIIYKNKTFDVLGDVDFTLLNSEYLQNVA